MARANEDVIEREFRKVATDMMETASIYYNVAESLMKTDNTSSLLYDYSTDTNYEDIRRTVASVLLAFSIELSLKAQIIYNDFSKLDEFTSDIDTVTPLQKAKPDGTVINYNYHTFAIGSDNWRKVLAGSCKLPNGDKASDLIKDPKSIIRKVLEVADSDDLRWLLEHEPKYNSSFLTLSTTSVNNGAIGHNLYAYAQIVHPIIKTLFNSELFSLFEKDFDKTSFIIAGLLFTNNLKPIEGLDLNPNNAQNEQALEMPEALYSQMGENSNVFDVSRYFSITGEKVSEADYNFLRKFAFAVCNVSAFSFPPLSIYEKYKDMVDRNRSQLNNSPEHIKNSSIVQQYWYLSLTPNERKMLEKYINDTFLYGMNEKRKVDPIDESLFTNLVLYIKARLLSQKPPIDIPFTYETFDIINKKIYSSSKMFNPFSKDNKRLQDFYLIDDNVIEEIKKQLNKQREELLSRIIVYPKNIDKLRLLAAKGKITLSTPSQTLYIKSLDSLNEDETVTFNKYIINNTKRDEIINVLKDYQIIDSEVESKLLCFSVPSEQELNEFFIYVRMIISSALITSEKKQEIMAAIIAILDNYVDDSEVSIKTILDNHYDSAVSIKTILDNRNIDNSDIIPKQK